MRMLIGGPEIYDAIKIARRLTTDSWQMELHFCSDIEMLWCQFCNRIEADEGRRNYIVTPSDIGLFQSEFPELMESYREMLDENDILLTNNIFLCNHLNPEEDELFFVWKDWYIELFSCEEFQKALEILNIVEALNYFSPEKLISLH